MFVVRWPLVVAVCVHLLAACRLLFAQWCVCVVCCVLLGDCYVLFVMC